MSDSWRHSQTAPVGGEFLSDRQAESSGLPTSCVSTFDDAVQNLITILGKKRSLATPGEIGGNWADMGTEIQVRACLEKLLYTHLGEAHAQQTAQHLLRQESFHRSAQQLQQKRARLLARREAEAKCAARERLLAEREDSLSAREERCAELEKALKLKEVQLAEQRKALARQMSSHSAQDVQSRATKAARTAGSSVATSLEPESPMSSSEAAWLKYREPVSPESPCHPRALVAKEAAVPLTERLAEAALWVDAAPGESERSSSRTSATSLASDTSLGDRIVPRPQHLPAYQYSLHPGELNDVNVGAADDLDTSSSGSRQRAAPLSAPLAWLTAPITAWRAQFGTQEELGN